MKFIINEKPKSYWHIAQLAKLFKIEIVDIMTPNAFGDIKNIDRISTAGDEWDFYTKDGSDYHFFNKTFYTEGYTQVDEIVFYADESHHLSYVVDKNDMDDIINYLVENKAIELI